MLLALLLILSTLHPSCWALTTRQEDTVGAITTYQPVGYGVALVIYDRLDCR